MRLGAANQWNIMRANTLGGSCARFGAPGNSNERPIPCDISGELLIGCRLTTGNQTQIPNDMNSTRESDFPQSRTKLKIPAYKSVKNPTVVQVFNRVGDSTRNSRRGRARLCQRFT